MAVTVTTCVAPGTYRIEHDGRAEVVYVVGPPHDWWACWNGEVFRGGTSSGAVAEVAGRRVSDRSLVAPMPARVVRVLVSAGSVVKAGDVLMVLEAMKMELAIRAPMDATVTSVSCREGDLVQPEMALVELEWA